MKNGKQKIIVAIISLIAVFLVQTSAQAFTWHVDQNNADCSNVSGMPYCDIQPAIDGASNGDTIVIAAGTYLEDLTTTDKGLTLEGAGADTTIIDGSGGCGAAIRFVSTGPSLNVAVSSLTVQNGVDGGIYVDKGVLEIANANVVNNTATLHSGGGVALGSGELIIQNSQIDENSALTCGGIYMGMGTLTLQGVSVDRNEASQQLGGLCQINGTANIQNSTVNNNTAALNIGGAYFAMVVLEIQDSHIDGNEVPGGSIGGLYVAAGSATLTRVSVNHNAVFGSMGGVYAVGGDLTIVDSTIDGNTAVGVVGGIYHDVGNFILRRSTVSNNGARQYAGGIYTGTGSVFSATNSTISHNWAFDGAGGILSSGTTSLRNVTLANNNADYDEDTVGVGGGVWQVAGSLNATHTIIAGNIDQGTSPDCSGSLASAGHNIIGDETGCSIAVSVEDQIGTAADPLDPLLEDLANNGGSTHTRALQFESLAIDAGDPLGCDDEYGNPLTVDQRGFDRPVGSACDIGAFEVGYCGDGYLDEDEDCDDGNSTAGDGCDSVCQVEVLVVEPEEVAETPDPSDPSDASDLSDLSDETDDTDELTENATTDSGGCSLAMAGSTGPSVGFILMSLVGLVGLLYKRSLV